MFRLGLGLSEQPLRTRGTITFDATSLALFAAMTVPPSLNRKVHLRDLIVGLKADGIWTKLAGLWLFAAHTSQAALLNVVAPGGTPAVLVGGTVFTADGGFAGNAVDGYVNTQLNDLTAPLAQDSASLFGYANVAGVTNSGNIAFWSTSNRLASNQGCRMRTATTLAYGAVPRVGLFAGDRADAATQRLFYNGVSQGTGAAVSAAPTAIPLHSHRNTVTSFGDSRIAVLGAGSSLTDAQHGQLYSRVLAYLQSMGAA